MCEFQEMPDEDKASNAKNASREKLPTEREDPTTAENEPPISFEDALALTKFGKFNYCLIVISGTILTAVLLDTLGMSYVIPVSECDMKLTTQDKGILSAIGFAGIISSSHLWGFLADTMGRRKIILPTLLIAFTCTVLSSLTQNFWLFVVLRYLNGFFVSGSSATVYAYLGEFHTIKQRSRAIMCASVIFGITCILLPVIAWLVINQEWELYIPIIDVMYKPWRLFLVVCGLPSLICGLALFKIPESPKFVLSQGKQDETIAILQRINKINNGKKAERLEISSIIEENESIENRKRIERNKKNSFHLLKSMWAQTAPLFMRPHVKKTLIACTIQFSIFFTSNGTYMWFPEILNRCADFIEQNPGKHASICEILDVTKLNLTAVFSQTEPKLNCTTKLEIATYEHSIVLELLYAFGFAFIGLVINSVGKLAILVIILAGCGICGVCTVFVDIPLLAIYFYLILLLAGLGNAVVNAATVDLFPTNLRAMAVCISLMMGRLGSVVGANVVGLLLDNYCRTAFIIPGSILIGAGMLAFFIPNIRQRSPKPQPPQQLEMGHRLSISSLGH